MKKLWWTRKVLCFFCRQQVIDNECGCWFRKL
nr:MAG TPA: Double-stranded RNA binding domain 2 [Caudoviricetes sp.]